MQAQRLIDVREFAAITGWKPSTVRQKVWRREVEFVRMGRSIRFRPDYAARLVEENVVPAISR